MKRIIREVITLIRIERWLVKEDASTEPSTTVEPDLIIEESIIEAQEPEQGDLRVIAQRILEARQWEVTPKKGTRSKRSTQVRPSPKEVE